MWKVPIKLRLAQLSKRGVTENDCAAALGMSRSQWSSLQKADRWNLTYQSLCKIALVLALPLEVLITRDEAAIASQPVPDWQWLAIIHQHGERIGSAPQSDGVPWGWAKLEAAYHAGEFGWMPTRTETTR